MNNSNGLVFISDISYLSFLSFFFLVSLNRALWIHQSFQRILILFTLLISCCLFISLPCCSGLLFFKIYFPLVAIDLNGSSFSSFLRWKIRLLIFYFSSFLIYAFSTISFPQSTAFKNFAKLQFHFHLVQHIFVSLETSLNHMLFILQIFGDFPAVFIWFISSLIPLWSESPLCHISMLLSLLRCILWSHIWAILVTVPCKLEKYPYSAIIEWSILWMSVKHQQIMSCSI